MKLYLFGASGSGVTTLGKALADRLDYPYLDSDDFLWEKTDPPYTTKRDKAERNQALTDLLCSNPNIILGGAVTSWGLECLNEFDLAVFLYVPAETRVQRLQQRERERFGDKVDHDPIMRQNFEGLITWAAGYDTDHECGRGYPKHEAWLSSPPCPVLEIRGDVSVEERIQIIFNRLDKNNKS